jgi:hypothetical protein
MDFRDVIYSLRADKSDAIGEVALGVLINAAVRAPGAVNDRPWPFTVPRDRVLLARVVGGHPVTFPPPVPRKPARSASPEPDDTDPR